MKLSNNSKTFYPDAYFKRVGYQKSDATSRVDALGQRVRDRFNEELETFEEPKKSTPGGLHSRTLKQLKNSNQKAGPGSAISISRKSQDIWTDKRYSVIKRKLNTQTDEMRNSTIDKDAMDKESVITKDRL